MKMATCDTVCLLLLTLFINSFRLTVQQKHEQSISFPLTFAPVPSKNSAFKPELLSSSYNKAGASSPPLKYRSPVSYSMALIASLPIGTPPQIQRMVLDTASQLSWIQCDQQSSNKKMPPPTASFDSSHSSSFYPVPCHDRACPISDYSLGASCDNKRMCRYSYFYADGTMAEGSLVRENFPLSSNPPTTPKSRAFSSGKISTSLVIGCAKERDSSGAQGILGMNLGQLSFISQTRVTKFSYCVPVRSGNNPNSGKFYLGDNPNYSKLQYVNLSIYPQAQTRPNLDTLAYTVPLVAIMIRGSKLNINKALFMPDAGGSGQTLMDSASEYTYLVEGAYAEVKKKVVQLAGPRRLKRGYEGDTCFNGNSREIGHMIGELVFQFGNGVQITIPEERNLHDVGSGVSCFGIKPTLVGSGNNIIGNFHQQNLWVEYDVSNKKVGFGKADCSKAV